MKVKSLLILPFLFLLSAPLLQAQDALKSTLLSIIGETQARVGVAVIIDGRDTLTIGNNYHYPMMSVFKFHQALAVVHWLQQNHLTLDTPVHISREELKPNTYSPLRDRYPEGNIDLTVGELLTYTLQQSDNNACDILFRLIGGTATTDRYIRSLGIQDFAITVNEDEMHQDPSLCQANWSTPLAAARLLECFLAQDRLHDKPLAFIHQTMIQCQTGTGRLASPLTGSKAIIGHKTGTGGFDEQGLLTGINDIGFVYLPDGHRYTIAVFVTESKETPQATEKIIARLSEAVYQHLFHLTLLNGAFNLQQDDSKITFHSKYDSFQEKIQTPWIGDLLKEILFR